ncbi:MAG: arsenate reductase ArsC [Gammaproteobacteria bacterium]|nr:arsenate reductase ArsC [Gammaproteobacteria bacterium]
MKTTLPLNTSKNVVFVCVENSCRSQIAEGFARLHQRADVIIYSAGSKPSGVINPRAIQFMQEVGSDLTRQGSKSLDEIPDIVYDAVITMGCGDACPFLRGKFREDWGLADPKHLSDDEFRAIRDTIQTRVAALFQQI